jgi:hypothetical protein
MNTRTVPSGPANKLARSSFFVLREIATLSVNILCLKIPVAAVCWCIVVSAV